MRILHEQFTSGSKYGDYHATMIGFMRSAEYILQNEDRGWSIVSYYGSLNPTDGNPCLYHIRDLLSASCQCLCQLS